MKEKKECPEGKVRNPKTGRCINEKKKEQKECPEGKIRNPKTGRCINEKKKEQKECPEGKIRNPKTGRCINEKKKEQQKKKVDEKSKNSPVMKSDVPKKSKSSPIATFVMKSDVPKKSTEKIVEHQLVNEKDYDDQKLYKLMDIMVKNKTQESKLDFFNYFDSLKDKDVLFDKIFKIKKSIPSSSLNGFISIISPKYIKDKTFLEETQFDKTEFILKTPKTSSLDNPVKEYNISKSLTVYCIKHGMNNFISNTWASVNCVPNYTNIKTNKEALKEDKACLLHEDLYKKRTHIIMDKINGKTLSYYLNKIPYKELYKCLCILLCKLNILRTRTGFTHYDLHYDNVMFEELEKEKEFIYNINKVEVKIKSRYSPIIIDFGRTYIKPKLTLGYINTRLINDRYYADDYEVSQTVNDIMDYIKSSSENHKIEQLFKNILVEFESLPYIKRCDYTEFEQKIIISASLIMGFLKNNKDLNYNSFIDYLKTEVCSRCTYDITSAKENNVVDFLRISCYVFQYTNNKNLLDTLRSNYPFLLNNFYLPENKIKNSKNIQGVFYIDDEIDLINLMIEKGLLEKCMKGYDKNYIKRDNLVFEPLLPDEKNKKDVKDILSSGLFKRSKWFYFF